MMPTKQKYLTGLVQMSCSPSPDENLQKAAALVEDAAQRGAEVVCLPELFRSQYFCQREDAELFDLAETVPGPTTETLGKVAKARGVVIVAPLFERRAPTTPLTTKSTISHPAIWGSAPLTRKWDASQR
jgi:N-carbamoylputrescine amidase